MINTSLGELSPKALQASLRHTTEALAAELVSPTCVAPRWSEREWLVAAAVATMHGIAPLLAATPRWQGPARWVQFLNEQTVSEQRRYARLGRLTHLLHEGLSEAGVAAVALKGTALYARGLYQPGQRPMADVDVLIGIDDAERASRILETLGFRESGASWKNREFSLFDRTGARTPQSGEHPIKVELHERVCEMLPVRTVDITRIIFPVRPSPGLNPYRSLSALMAHLLLHTAGSILDRTVRLVQLHDIALLARYLTEQDWSTLLRGPPAGHTRWWAFPPLILTARYYPGRIPAPALSNARAFCPRLLRRISERQDLSSVSLSYPWIEAFPGFAWTRSPFEAIEYLARRFVRDTESTSLRRTAATTEPHLSPEERRWLRVTHGERILRWMLLRPARALTMRAVRISFSAARQSSDSTDSAESLARLGLSRRGV